MRKHFVDYGYIIDVKNDKDCVFCEHCSYLYDSHGPYMFTCDLNHKEADEAPDYIHHTCKDFEDTNENTELYLEEKNKSLRCLDARHLYDAGIITAEEYINFYNKINS